MTRKILGLLLSLTLSGAQYLHAQEQPGLREKAEILYSRAEYSRAVVLYQKLAVRKNSALSDLQHLAYSYFKMKKYDDAEKWYSLILKNPKRSNDDLLTYANILKIKGHYADAKNAFLVYSQNSGISATSAIAGCDSALKWTATPTTHVIKNESSLNSSRADFSPFLGKTHIFYTTEPEGNDQDRYGWTGNSFTRILSATKGANGEWGIPAMVKDKFNEGNYNIGPVCFTRDGGILYITKTHNGEQAQPQKQAKKLYSKVLELFIYKKDSSGNWIGNAFRYNNPKAYSVGHAALSPDEKTLYFASDMPGGLGGTDLWYCTKKADGTWASPINCGKNINTAGEELFPTMKEDGTLFFSSDSHLGMGGLDIFSSTGSGSLWSEPVNLRFPVNSSADDFGFIEINNPSGSTGYLSSNRAGGKGSDDIYSFSYKAPIKFILAASGTVSDKKYKRPVVEASVMLLKDNKVVVRKEVSSNKGQYFFELEKDTRYTIKARKSGYLPDSIVFNTNGIKVSDTLEYSLRLDPLEKGKTIRLDNIFYDLGKENIRADAASILNGLELLMRENPKLKIELSSHTDSRGKDAYNLALSQRRAQSAVIYLISRGIAKERMVAKGYGETRLINKCGNSSNCTEEEHQKNRRTEFTILSN